MEFSLPSLSQSFSQTIPLLILLVTGLGLMLLDAFKVQPAMRWVTIAGLLASMLTAMFGDHSGETIAFFGMIETGGLAPIIHSMLCLAGLFPLFFVNDYFRRQNKADYDVFALLIFAVLGMILLANARDLLLTFIGLEIMSMCLYIFAALYKMDPRSNEAGMKYFLLGAFASAFLLFGIALIYGISGYFDPTAAEGGSYVAGSTNFSVISNNLIEIISRPELLDQSIGLGADERIMILMIAIGLILVGFLFKVAAFPFHSWAPDVYQGSPTPLAGFMATGSKMAAFIALGSIMMELNFLTYDKVKTILAASALLTMIYGNIVAARQKNIKRMLAYSSIAHSGYVLLGLCAVGENPEFFSAVLFYMFIYTLMNVGAFGMVSMAEHQHSDTDLDSWKGLGNKHPWFAGALSVFMLSLAGIPPLAGFMAKYLVFIAAIQTDLVVLATIGILSSVVGAFYYLRVISTMFFSKEENNTLKLNYGKAPIIGVAILVLLILYFGIFPSNLLTLLEGDVVQSIGSIIPVGR